MTRSLLHEARPEPVGVALLEKGFRPFFLCAAAYAVVAIPLFLAGWSGRYAPSAYLPSMYWHAHEMVFGFTMAVFAGFLLTAVENWTSRRTARGAPLAGLVFLWIVGRVAMLAPAGFPDRVVALLDLAFLPALLVACARPILAAENSRNDGFVVLLAALWGSNAAVHLAALGILDADWERRGSVVAVDLVVVAMVVMTGRIVPLFTRNALRMPGVASRPRLERATLAAAAALPLLDAFGASPRVEGPIALVAGVCGLLRMSGWKSRYTLRDPLLWVLHAGCGWLATGLLLRGAGAVLAVPFESGLHALTAGAIGTLTLGMMARVALGHTGRALVAPRGVTVAFGAVSACGVIRVAAPLVSPGVLAPLIVAGVLWSFAFGTYFVLYGRLLVLPRVDGRPG